MSVSAITETTTPPPNIVRKIYYLDSLRILAMMLVITLHCIGEFFQYTPNFGTPLWYQIGVVNELCRMGVPLFFMISGCLLLTSAKTDNLSHFYSHRMVKLLIPFLFWDIVYFLYFRIPDGQPLLISDFFKELLSNGSSYHLWFVYAIMLLYLFLPFIKKITDNCSGKILLLFFLLSVFQTTIKPFLNIIFGDHLYIFLSEDGFIGYLGYMLLGYILGKYTISRPLRIGIYVLSIASILCFSTWNCHLINIGEGYIWNGGYTINHYIEAAGVFLLFKHCLNRKNIFTRVTSTLSAACMTAYFVHIIVMEWVKNYTGAFSPQISMLYTAVATILISFLTGLVVLKLKNIVRINKKR